MPTPPLPDSELERRKTVIEDCLREGFAPLGQHGGKGSALEEARRRLGLKSSGSLTRDLRDGRIVPDWSLYQQPKPPAPEPTERFLQDNFPPPPPPAWVAGPIYDYVSRPDNTFWFGALGDTHAGSKYERLDVLEKLYEHYANEGVDRVYHTGNWIDGEARFNTHDLHTHGLDNQVRYLAETYPQKPGITTYAVHGDDHEGWYGQREGIDVGRYCEQRFRDSGRQDWVDLGFMEAHIRLINANTGKWCVMAVCHPGGGSSYAISYKIQKIVESYEGGEKPAVGLYGHLHKMWSGIIRNVWCFETACVQDQTPFMRKRNLEAHVGGFVIGLEQDPRTGAIVAAKEEKRRYFNLAYYGGGRWSKAGRVVLPERRIAGVAA